MSRAAPSVAVLVAGFAFSLASVAFAQTGSTGEAVFPEGQRKSNARQTLDVTASLFSTFDDGVFAGRAPSFYPELKTTLAYSKRRERLTLEASAATIVSHDPDPDGLAAASYSGATGVGFNMTRRMTLRAHGDASVAPYLAPTPFPSLSAPDLNTFSLDDSRYTVLRGQIRSSAAGADVTRILSDRATAMVGWSFRRTGSLDETLDFGERSATSEFGHRLGRHTDLRVGYTYRAGHDGTQGDARTIRTHEVGIGIGRAWRHSRSRQTTISVAGGPTSVDREEGRFYRVAGRIELTHQINKTWRATAFYRRGMESITGFGDAPFSDAVSGGIMGHLGDRLRFDATAGRSVGQIGFEVLDNGYDTYAGSARLAFAVRSRLAVYGEYFYYGFKFGNDVLLPQRYVRELDRRGPRVGLTFSIPFARQEQRQ